MPSIYMSCTDQGKVIINDNFEFTNDIGEVSINNEAENTFVFKPNANYQLTKVLINGEDVTSSVKNNQLTTMIPAGSKMNVVFSQKTGDVNGDGTVDISDVVKLVNIILGGSTGEEPNGEAIEENGIYWGIYPGTDYTAGDNAAINTYVSVNKDTMIRNATRATGVETGTQYESPNSQDFDSFFVAYPSSMGFPNIYMVEQGSAGDPLNTNRGATVTVKYNNKDYKVWVLYNNFPGTPYNAKIRILQSQN